MGIASASSLDVSRPTSQGELDRLERKVTRNSYLFLLFGLLYLATSGLNLAGFSSSSKAPTVGIEWGMLAYTLVMGAAHFLSFALARRTPCTRGFGLGFSLILVFLGTPFVRAPRPEVHWIGLIVMATLLVGGILSFLTARKYDRALEERDAREAAGAETSGP